MNVTYLARKVVNTVRKAQGKVAQSPFVPLPKTGADVLELSTKEPKLSKIKRLQQFFKSCLVKIDKPTIKRLEALPLQDFLTESQKIIGKSMGLSNDFLPPLQIAEFKNKKSNMFFDCTSNVIHVGNHTVDKVGRYQLFALLRHEMQHYKQNLLVLRTSGLGEEAIEKYTQLQTKAQVDAFIEYFSKLSESEIVKIKETNNLPKDTLIFIDRLRVALTQGDEAFSKFRDEVINYQYSFFFNKIKGLRDKVVDLFGAVGAETKEAKTAQKYFEEFFSNSGMSRGSKYHSSDIEVEAYAAQLSVVFEYLIKKFFG